MSIRKQIARDVNRNRLDAVASAVAPTVERLEHRRLMSSARLIGITGNQQAGNPPDETLYDINPSNASVSQLITLPFVPDTDAIAYNPSNGLLYRTSGSSSYRDQANRIGYHDNQFMQTVDMRTPAMTQAGVFNANFQGEDNLGLPTGNYGLNAPFPTFLNPDHRRLDTETDHSFALDGPNEYSAARDFTWSVADQAFFVSDSDGIYRLTATGTSTFIGNPALTPGAGGPKGLSFVNFNGQRRLLVGERDGSKLWFVDPATGQAIGNGFQLGDQFTNPTVAGTLSIVESPDGSALLALVKPASDPSNAFGRQLVQINLQETSTGTGTAVTTARGTFSIHMADLAFVPGTSAELSGKRVLYNNTILDGNTPAAGAQDDAAVDYAKSPIPAGGPVTAANLTSYSRGLNSVAVDLFALPQATATLTAADFTIRSTSPSSPNTFVAGPAPTSVSFRRGAGPGGSDRVELIWSDATAVRNGYLEVTVKANANTGLSAAEKFTYGNLVGDANGDRAVTVGDLGILATNFNLSPRTFSQGDFNGDGTVTVGDLGSLATNFNLTIPLPPAALQAPAVKSSTSTLSTNTATSLFSTKKVRAYQDRSSRLLD